MCVAKARNEYLVIIMHFPPFIDGLDGEAAGRGTDGVGKLASGCAVPRKAEQLDD